MSEMWEDLERETLIERTAEPVNLGSLKVIKYIWRKIVADVAGARRAETKRSDEIFGTCDGVILSEGARAFSHYEEVDLTISKIPPARKY